MPQCISPLSTMHAIRVLSSIPKTELLYYNKDLQFDWVNRTEDIVTLASQNKVILKEMVILVKKVVG